MRNNKKVVKELLKLAKDIVSKKEDFNKIKHFLDSLPFQFNNINEDFKETCSKLKDISNNNMKLFKSEIENYKKHSNLILKSIKNIMLDFNDVIDSMGE